MAVEFIAIGATATSASGEAVNVDIPSGNNGELLFMVCECEGNTTCPSPSGWTTAVDTAIPGVSVSTTHTTFRTKWRIRDGTEGSTVSVDPGAGTVNINILTFAAGFNESHPIGVHQTECIVIASDLTPLTSVGFMPIGSAAVCYSTSVGNAVAAASGGTDLTWTEAQDGSGESWAINIAEATADTYLFGQQMATTLTNTLCLAFSILIMPDDKRDQQETSTGTGSFSVPAGYQTVRLICTAGGGGGSVNTGAEGGGGGGAHSETTSIDVSSQPTIYRSIGTGGAVATAGGDTWLRVGTNSAPSSTTDGCLAKGGSGGSGAGSGGGAGGVTSTGVGDIKFGGGAGANGQGGGGTRGGSGGGAAGSYGSTGQNGTAGSGSTAGLGGLMTIYGGARGGQGGVSGGAGQLGRGYGGGGGGGGNSGGNAGAGAQGRVRMVFTLTPPATVGRATEVDTASPRGIALPAKRADTTNTAFAPSGPTQVVQPGRMHPKRRDIKTFAGVGDGSGNFVINTSTLIFKPSDLVIVHVAIQTNTDLTAGLSCDGNVNGNLPAFSGPAYVNGTNDINHAVFADKFNILDGTYTIFNVGIGQRVVAQLMTYSSVDDSQLASSGASSNPTTSTLTWSGNLSAGDKNGGTIVLFGAAAMDNAQTWDTPPANVNNFNQVDDQDSSGHGARICTGDFYWVGVDFSPNQAVNSGATAADTGRAADVGLLAAVGTQEEDSASARGLAHGIGRANETDSAFALSQGVIQVPVGQANETDTALKAGGIGMAPNRPIETDTAFNRGTVLQVQRANETDQAFQLTRLGGVGVAIEADTAFALGKVFILPCGGRVMVRNGHFSSSVLPDWNTVQSTISVVNGRLRVTASTTGNNNQHANADFPHTSPLLGNGSWYRIKGEGFAGNRDAVIRLNQGAAGAPGQPYINTAFDVEYQLTNTFVNFACHVGNNISVTAGDFAEFDNLEIYPLTRESDTAFALNRLDTPAWTRSNETDSAFSLTAGFPVVRANETDSAFARTGVFIRPVSRSDEVDSAFQLNRLVTVPIARADETDTASRLGFGTPAVRANEADTAFARNALITVDHGFSIETDTAFQMFGALEAGSGRKPHIRLDGILRDRVQPVHKVL